MGMTVPLHPHRLGRGPQHRWAWTDEIWFEKGDTVEFGCARWVALMANLRVEPGTDPKVWQRIEPDAFGVYHPQPGIDFHE